MRIRTRIKELRFVTASELIPNDKNWRRHPGTQRQALLKSLETLGYADALIARQTPQGLQLLDGHLRASTTPNMKVPVLIVDLSDEEANTLLATLDPLSAMAETDTDALASLIKQANLLEDELLTLALSTSQEFPTSPIPDSTPIDPNSLFQEPKPKPSEPKEPKTHTCPNCGHSFQ